MASCTSYTLSGLQAQCKDSIGGVAKIWLSTVADASVSISDNVADVSANSFKVYNLRKGSASMTTNLTVNENAGDYWTTEVSMDFLKMETNKRLEMMAITMGETIAVVKDNNSKYWVVGVNNATGDLVPLTASAGVGETGTAKSDSNHYNVTLSVDTTELPYEITKAETITAFEGITVA